MQSKSTFIFTKYVRFSNITKPDHNTWHGMTEMYWHGTLRILICKNENTHTFLIKIIPFYPRVSTYIAGSLKKNKQQIRNLKALYDMSLVTFWDHSASAIWDKQSYLLISTTPNELESPTWTISTFDLF